MTSYILLKKIANTSLDETSITRVRSDIKKATKRRSEAAKKLKYILENRNNTKRCCICLESGNHWIFEENDFNIASNIQFVLGIKVTENDDNPKHICPSCLQDLKTATKLKHTAETTHWRLQQDRELVADLNEDREVTLVAPVAKGTGRTDRTAYFKATKEGIVREWKCSKCRLRFSKLDDYTSHVESNTCRRKNYSEKYHVFVCEVCGKQFKNRNIYNGHRILHTEILKYVCPECPYRARRPAFLRFHMRIHTGEKPVQCPHCPKTFSRPSNLVSHRRVHFPPKHHCHCGKSFNSKGSLERHRISIHTNIKSHVCPTCGVAFSSRARQRSHELKIHKAAKRRGGAIPTYIMLREGDQTDLDSAREIFAAELGLLR